MKFLRSVKLFLITLLVFLSIFKANCQLRLSGIVIDSFQTPIVNATIVVCSSKSNSIIAYAITNKSGEFSLQFSRVTSLDSIYIQASALNYDIIRKEVLSYTTPIEITLRSKSIFLPPVIVKNNKPLVKFSGDTLSYSVDSFKNGVDRNIGDVIKKMPGIEVNANGKISYNGRAISNFYIDGDNLLDDKYNLATNSIPPDIVDKIQVLENHQPIKVLKDASISNNVALNINLKETGRLKISGYSELTEGYSTENNFNASLVGMIFKKKYKSINAIKANNTGVDLNDDIISHNYLDYLKRLDQEVPSSLLSAGNFAPPEFSKNRYLFNNARSLNTNTLFKSKNGLQVKINAYVVSDKQNRDYNNSNWFFIQNDTTKYFEIDHSVIMPLNMHLQINLNDNKATKYLNNSTLVDFNNENSLSNLSINNNPLNQKYRGKSFTLSNELNILYTLKKKRIIEVFSFVSFYKNPESLELSPEINSNIFNLNNPFTELRQKSNIPSLFTNNFITMRCPSIRFFQTYKIGISGQWQDLNSNIEITQPNGTINILTDSFANNLNWKRFKLYSEATYDFILPKLQISSSFPINVQSIKYFDTNHLANYTIGKFFFNPSVNIKILTGSESSISTGYSFASQVSNLEDVYKGYILKSYDLLANKGVPFWEGNMHNVSLGFNLRNTIKMFFFNILGTYSFLESNSIISTSFYQNIQKQSSLLLNNKTKSFTLFTSISKYFKAVHSTVTLKATFRNGDANQIQEGFFLQFYNSSISYVGSINTKPFSWLNASYSCTYTNYNSKNRLQIQPNQASQIVQQKISINFLPSNRFFISTSVDDYSLHHTQSGRDYNYLFADASIVLKLFKLKSDISINLLNIGNVKAFKNISLTSNNLTQYSYTIRPRMLLLKVTFNF